MGFYRPEPEIVESHPAYDVVRYKPDYRGHVHLKAGDKLRSGLMRKGAINSVFSSAIKSNSCPLGNYENAKRHGHDVYYIYGLGTMLSASPLEKETFIVVDYDQVYRFEGRLFKIVDAPNDNLSLVEQERPQGFY